MSAFAKTKVCYEHCVSRYAYTRFHRPTSYTEDYSGIDSMETYMNKVECLLHMQEYLLTGVGLYGDYD